MTYGMCVADPGYVFTRGPVLHGQCSFVDQLASNLSNITTTVLLICLINIREQKTPMFNLKVHSTLYLVLQQGSNLKK